MPTIHMTTDVHGSLAVSPQFTPPSGATKARVTVKNRTDQVVYEASNVSGTPDQIVRCGASYNTTLHAAPGGPALWDEPNSSFDNRVGVRGPLPEVHTAGGPTYAAFQAFNIPLADWPSLRLYARSTGRRILQWLDGATHGSLRIIEERTTIEVEVEFS